MKVPAYDPSGLLEVDEASPSDEEEGDDGRLIRFEVALSAIAVVGKKPSPTSDSSQVSITPAWPLVTRIRRRSLTTNSMATMQRLSW